MAHTFPRSSIISVKSEKRFLNKAITHRLCKKNAYGSVENGPEWKRNWWQESNEKTVRKDDMIESTSWCWWQ